MEIALGNIDNEEFNAFIERLGISPDDYKSNIGFRTRFSSVVELYDSFESNYENLLNELYLLKKNDDPANKDKQRGSIHLVGIISNIIKGEIDFSKTPLIINYLLDMRRLSVRTVIDNITKKNKGKTDLDKLINKIIKCKYSYIEHEFYNKTNLIYYFLKINKIDDKSLEIFRSKITGRIESLYYINNNQRRMLYEIGIYDKDIIQIIKVIGDEFDNMVDLVDRLEIEWKNYYKKISFVSRFLISNLIKNNN